jgi:GNAT superfamily N-acetyltransferase
MGEMVLRPADQTDRPAILELAKRTFGQGQIPDDPEYWSWKHDRNPFGPSAILVSEVDGCLVGLRVFMRWRWSAGGQVFESVRAVDTATHPQWQGRGIFSRLTLALVDQMTKEGVAFVFNTPNKKSGPGYLKMGWSIVGRMTMWIRPLRPRRLMRAWLQRGGTHGGDGLPCEAGRDFGSARALVAEPGLADLLVRSVGTGKPLVTALTPAYLRWRYADAPGFDYRAAWTFRGGHGAAVVFRLKRQASLCELRLCEIMAAPTRDSVHLGAGLVRDVVGQCNADFASAMGRLGTPEQRVLVRAGFFPVPRAAPVLTVRPLCVEALVVDPLLPASWRLSTGTLELF